MKKSIIAAVIAVLAVLVMAGPVQSASTKPTYVTPKNVTAFEGDGNTAEVVWTASPYADFYRIKLSKNSDMSNPFYVTPQDVQNREAGQFAGANGYTVFDLEPNKRYYVQVAVVNFNNAKLSAYSTKVSFRTAPAA